MPLSKKDLKKDILDLILSAELSTAQQAARAWLTVLSNYISELSVPPSITIAVTATGAMSATLAALSASFVVIPSNPPISFLPIDTVFMPFLLTDANSLTLFNVLTPPVGFGEYAFVGINDEDDNEMVAKKIADNIHKMMTKSVWVNTVSGATGTWA